MYDDALQSGLSILALGGQSWQEHEGGILREFIYEGSVVSYEDDFLGATGSSRPLARSSDGVEFEFEDISGTDAGLSDVHVHDGTLLGLTDDEPRRLLSYDSESDRWSEVALGDAPEVEVSNITSVADSLIVELDGAGLWRTDDLDNWSPIGVPTSEPRRTAVIDEASCAYGGIQNLTACTEGDDRNWRFYGSAAEPIEAMYADRGRALIIRETDEGNELLRFDAEDGPSPVMDEPLGLSETTNAFEWGGDTWVVARESGLHRITDDGELERVDHRLSDSGRISVVTPFDDELWLTTYRDDQWSIRRSSNADDWTNADSGLPDPNEHDGDMRPPYPAQMAASEAHIYAIFSFPDEKTSQRRPYRWSPEHERWVANSMPDEETLDGDRLRGFAGGDRGLYAASHSDVFQYDPSRDRWRTLSDGLDGELRPGSLTASNGRLLVGLWGRGLYEYIE